MLEAFFIGIIIGTVGGLVFVIWSAVSGHRRRKNNGRGQSAPDRYDLNDQPGLSTGTKLMLGAMGAKLLDDQFEKHKRESEQKQRDLFLWQDSAREKMRDD